jgi:DNA-binding GntR family transcriptional regulator
VYLINAYALISGRIAALRTYNVINSDPLRRSKAMTEHRAIVAALAKGDLERAEVILDEHVSRMRIVYLAARRHEAGTPARLAQGQ